MSYKERWINAYASAPEDWTEAEKVAYAEEVAQDGEADACDAAYERGREEGWT